MNTTTAPTTTTLALTGAQWRALATHYCTDATRYAMKGVGWFPMPEQAVGWLTGASVAVATQGKSALFLPHPETCPTDCLLVSTPKVPNTKVGRAQCHVAMTAPNGSDGHFPPATNRNVLPSRGDYTDGLEASTDDWRALFGVCQASPIGERGDPEPGTLRLSDRGAELSARIVGTDVTIRATLGSAPQDGETVRLDARLVRAVLDAADLLGANLVTVSVHRTESKRGRSPVAFSLAGRALAVVMPLSGA